MTGVLLLTDLLGIYTIISELSLSILTWGRSTKRESTVTVYKLVKLEPMVDTIMELTVNILFH